MSRYDEKSFLDLLQEYKSDDARKARRNLSAISFIVISTWILGIRFTELKVFGIDLTKSSELYVLLLGLLLNSYWVVMFWLARRYDIEIQKERATLLNTTVTQLKKRLTEIEITKEKHKDRGGYVPDDYSEVKGAVEAYELQQLRTATATSLARIIRQIELYIPIVLAFLSFCILIFGIGRAL